MNFNLRNIYLNTRWFLKGLFNIDKQDRVKTFLLTAAFFLVIASYTLVKELKDSIFIEIVGKDYFATAKIVSMFVLIPAILLYAYLVDNMRRYKLLCAYSIAYGIFGLLFAYFLGDSSIGIANTVASKYRIIGWLFYFFIEGYSPFVVSLFWAFANSVNSPKSASKSYAFMVAGSKLGGTLSAGMAWYLFSCSIPSVMNLSHTAKHQIILTISASLLLLVPILIYFLIKKVPGRYLHGYEAAYKVEKSKAKDSKLEEKSIIKKESSKSKKPKPGLFQGLYLLIKYPYVMGIFGMIFFYEIVNVILSYHRIMLAKDFSSNISGLSCILFEQIFWVHLVGFMISFFGTNALLRIFGERKTLLFIPLASGVLIFGFIYMRSLSFAIVVFTCLRAINYAISYPVRESLYVPTVKDIKFKSKAWIDAFGTKFAKTIGGFSNVLFNFVMANGSAIMLFWVQISIFGTIVAAWTLTAYLLGVKFNKVIAKNQVIGAD